MIQISIADNVELVSMGEEGIGFMDADGGEVMVPVVVLEEMIKAAPLLFSKCKVTLQIEAIPE